MAVKSCGGTSGTPSALLLTVSQSAHGFSILDPIYWNGTQWNKARSNSASTLATHVVISVSSADSFKCSNSGSHIVTAHGKTVSSWYYTDPETLGGTTLTEPTFQGTYSNPVYLPIDVDTIQVFPFRASQVQDEGSQRYALLMGGI